MQHWIIDIDHVLWRNGLPIAGSQKALAILRQQQIKFRLLTNDSVSGASNKLARLRAVGFDIAAEELITASILAGRYLSQSNLSAPIILASREAAADVGFESATTCDIADSVVIGDMFRHYSFEMLQEAIKALVNGAPLIAMQRNRWCGPRQLGAVDVGFWVAAFEYVIDCEAILVGKPARKAFQLTLQSMGVLESPGVVMVGDDLEVDLHEPARMGMRTIQIGDDYDSKKPDWLDARYSCLLDAVKAHYY